MSICIGDNLMVNRLKYYRFIRQKTQDQIFIETGIPQSKLSRIENMYLRPGESEKTVLAKALGTTTEELFSSEE